MSQPAFISHLLDDTTITEGFTCGIDSLDTWITNHARRAQRASIARVTVWTPAQGPRVVQGFYSISPTQVARQEVSRSLSAGFSVVPSWLLGRLALHTRWQGQGLGSQLLLDALDAIAAASKTGAGRLVLVDPIDPAAVRFYSRFGFTSLRTDEPLAKMALRVDEISQVASGK